MQKQKLSQPRNRSSPNLVPEFYVGVLLSFICPGTPLGIQNSGHFVPVLSLFVHISLTVYQESYLCDVWNDTSLVWQCEMWQTPCRSGYSFELDHHLIAIYGKFCRRHLAPLVTPASYLFVCCLGMKEVSFTRRCDTSWHPNIKQFPGLRMFVINLICALFRNAASLACPRIQRPLTVKSGGCNRYELMKSGNELGCLWWVIVHPKWMEEH